MLYKSKIGLWFLLISLGVPLGLLVGFRFWEISGIPDLFVSVVVFSVIVFLPGWILMTTDYRFRNENLHIRSGPFKWEIPLSNVKHIEQSRSLASAPALSLDRLKIHFGSNECILISPKDKNGFLAEIESRRAESSCQ